MISPSISVRVWFSTERATEAERELSKLAESRPKRVTDGFLVKDWVFLTRETADLFKVCADNVAGVLKVEVR